MRNKKLYLLSLLLIVALAFTACGDTTEEGTIDQEPAVGQEEEVVGVEPTLALEPTEEVVDEVAGDLGEPTATVVVEPTTEELTTEEDTTTEEDMVDTPVVTSTEPLTDSTAVIEPEDEMTDEMAEGETGMEEEVIPSTGAVNVNALSNVVDFEIRNNNDEEIGDIEAVVIDMNRSEIKYVVVGVGGFLGIGEKSVAIPYQALTLNQPMVDETTTDEVTEATPNVFVVDVNVESMENAPAFDLNLIENPMDTMDETMGDEDAQTTTDEAQMTTFEDQEQQTRSFWEDEMGISLSDELESSTTLTDTTTTESSMDTMGTPHYVLADSLLGATVVNETMGVTQDEDMDLDAEESSEELTTDDDSPIAAADEQQELGEVHDLAIDSNSGKVNYVLIDLNDDVVSPDEEAATDDGMFEDQLTAIPLTSFQWNSEDETLSFTGTQPIESAPTITSDQFYSGDMSWESDIDNFWENFDLDNN